MHRTLTTRPALSAAVTLSHRCKAHPATTPPKITRQDRLALIIYHLHLPAVPMPFMSLLLVIFNSTNDKNAHSRTSRSQRTAVGLGSPMYKGSRALESAQGSCKAPQSRSQCYSVYCTGHHTKPKGAKVPGRLLILHHLIFPNTTALSDCFTARWRSADSVRRSDTLRWTSCQSGTPPAVRRGRGSIPASASPL